MLSRFKCTTKHEISRSSRWISYLMMLYEFNLIESYRKFTMPVMQSVRLFLIQESWESSRSVVERCGWENVCIFAHWLVLTQTSLPVKVNGTGQAKISLSPFGTTTKLDPPKGFKSSNIWYWRTCWLEVRWIHLIVRKPSRKSYFAFMISFEILAINQVQDRPSDQSYDRPCWRLPASWGAPCGEDFER